MRNEVRQRIEQIRQGQVPAGYQKGKIGVVPLEWKEISFSSLFMSISDYTGDLKTYPLYSLTIEAGVIPKTERYERSHLVKKEDAYKIVRPDDFVYNPMNLRFGAVARYKGTQPVSVSGYYDVFTTTYKSDLSFMDNFLVCGPMLTYYDRVSTGSLVEKQRVHFASFINFSFPLPPREEREKIARILMTQDRLIALREKLLAEKLRQKQYLMQVLLTGKKRLCGSTRIWQYQALKDISREITKKAGNEKYEVLSISAGIGFVNQAKKFGKLIAGKQYKNYIVISHGDFSYNKGNSKKYPQGCVYPLENQDKAAVPNVFISFRLDKNICFWKFYKGYVTTNS